MGASRALSPTREITKGIGGEVKFIVAGAGSMIVAQALRKRLWDSVDILKFCNVIN